jgi:MoaA/NifB/PqqE/SkfB family radical SAM enzyme
VRLRSKAAFARAVLRYRIRGARTPIAIAWLVTGRCTASCSYCRWKDQRASEELDPPSALRLIDEMRDAGVLMVSFTGGEPLLREDIGTLIRHAKRRGAVCKLNTNGDLVARRLDQLRPLDLLQISLDGPPDVQDGLRGKGSARRAATAITLARREGIPVQAVACLTRDNVDRLDEVLAYAAGLGVRLHVQPLAPGSEEGGALPTRERLVRALSHLLSLHESGHPLAGSLGTTPSELRYHHRVHAEGLRGCHCAIVTATVLPDGKMIFCGSARDPEVHDTRALGFAEAFKRLTLPDCDGCTCVGKLRISQVCKLDPATVLDLLFQRPLGGGVRRNPR